MLADAARRQIHRLGYRLLQFVLGHVAGAMGVDIDRQRPRHAEPAPPVTSTLMSSRISRLFRRCYPGRGEEWVSAQANWPLCLMLRIGNAQNGARTLRMENNSTDSLQLIVPNLHRRYSGVTATNRMVAPKLARLFRAAWLGSHAPEGIARMGVVD